MEKSDLLNYILIGIVSIAIVFGILSIVTVSADNGQMNTWLLFLMRLVQIYVVAG